MRRIVLLLLVVAAAGIAAAVALAATSPKKLRSSIESAMFSQSSVHYVETATANGLRQTTEGDAATDRGIQQITVHLHRKTGRFTVLVVKQIAYLRGDRTALNLYLGFPPAPAKKYAGRWISIPNTSPAYGSLSADVTVASIAADHVGSRKISVVNGTVGGVSVIGLRGVTRVSGVYNTSTVYVRSARQARPIQITDVASKQGFKDRFDFSQWGESLHLTAPKHAVSISKLG